LLALTDPMIATTELRPTPQTSNGSGRGFLRIAMGNVLAVAAIAALVSWSAESPDLDLTDTPKAQECPIHHVPLVVARAPITYGDANDWQRDYFHASKVSFPHAGRIVFASTLSRFSDYTESTYRFARVSQCPECVRAEQHWYDPGAKLK
jgi:hypothetical protein